MTTKTPDKTIRLRHNIVERVVETQRRLQTVSVVTITLSDAAHYLLEQGLDHLEAEKESLAWRR